jgi:hypothetical protein
MVRRRGPERAELTPHRAAAAVAVCSTSGELDTVAPLVSSRILNKNRISVREKNGFLTEAQLQFYGYVYLDVVPV